VLRIVFPAVENWRQIFRHGKAMAVGKGRSVPIQRTMPS
jgi:hypothetical protein